MNMGNDSPFFGISVALLVELVRETMREYEQVKHKQDRSGK